MEEIHLEFGSLHQDGNSEREQLFPDDGHEDEITLNEEDDLAAENFLLEQANKKALNEDDDFDVDFNVGVIPTDVVPTDVAPTDVAPDDVARGDATTSAAELTPSRDVSAPSDDVIKLKRGTVEATEVRRGEVTSVLRTTTPRQWHRTDYSQQANLRHAQTEVCSVPAERVALEHINSPQVIIQAQETTLKEDSQPSSKFGVVVRMSGNAEDLIHNVPPDDYQTMKARWDAVAASGMDEDEMDKLESGGGRPKIADVDFNEVMDHFRTSNTERYKYAIHPVSRASGWKGIKRRYFSTKLQRTLIPDRDLFFCMAACPFDNNEPVHQRMLQTIYRRLTLVKRDCPRYGSHWEHIGFQGNDPSTDLRASGMLSLIMLIYMLTSSQLKTLSHNIYQLSLHWDQNFPFCLMSINMTRIVVQALRDGLLNKLCNHEKNVFTVCHSLYVAGYLHMYTIWRKQHKTIKDSGLVLQEVEKFVRKTPKSALTNLGDYLEGPQQSEATSLPVQAFTGVIELADKVAG